MTHDVNLNFAKQSSRKKDNYCNYEMDIPPYPQDPWNPDPHIIQGNKICKAQKSERMQILT
jgi:hypothetical protein